MNLKSTIDNLSTFSSFSLLMQLNETINPIRQVGLYRLIVLVLKSNKKLNI